MCQRDARKHFGVKLEQKNDEANYIDEFGPMPELINSLSGEKYYDVFVFRPRIWSWNDTLYDCALLGIGWPDAKITPYLTRREALKLHRQLFFGCVAGTWRQIADWNYTDTAYRKHFPDHPCGKTTCENFMNSPRSKRALPSLLGRLGRRGGRGGGTGGGRGGGRRPVGVRQSARIKGRPVKKKPGEKTKKTALAAAVGNMVRAGASSATRYAVRNMARAQQSLSNLAYWPDGQEAPFWRYTENRHVGALKQKGAKLLKKSLVCDSCLILFPFLQVTL